MQNGLFKRFLCQESCIAERGGLVLHEEVWHEWREKHVREILDKGAVREWWRVQWV